MKKIFIIISLLIGVLIIVGVLASRNSDVRHSFESGMEQGKQAVEGK